MEFQEKERETKNLKKKRQKKKKEEEDKEEILTRTGKKTNKLKKEGITTRGKNEEE